MKKQFCVAIALFLTIFTNSQAQSFKLPASLEAGDAAMPQVISALADTLLHPIAIPM